MTTRISTGNRVAAGQGGWPGLQQPGGATGAPGEAQLRGVPAAAAGATGAAPTDGVGVPSATSADAAYYFLQAAQPGSPQVLPLLNLAPPGAEPPLGFTVPATAGAAHPRGAPGRSAVPGQHLGSTVPATPGIELGAQPLVPAVPPASAFGVPSEHTVRPAPAAAAGAARLSPQSPALVPASGDLVPHGSQTFGLLGGPSLYFLDELVSPGAPVPADEPAAAAILPQVLAGPAR